MLDIGTRIKERRLQLGLSAEELAPLVGLSAATIYRYENGDIKKVNTTKLQSFAKALKTNESYLMGWISECEPASDSVISDQLSPAALAVARAYDQMSEYGKSMIDKIVENEKAYKVVKAIPLMEMGDDSKLMVEYLHGKRQKEMDQAVQDYENQLNAAFDANNNDE